MSAQILFTDLDGTLLNDQKEITPGNRQAIGEALAAGRPPPGGACPAHCGRRSRWA